MKMMMKLCILSLLSIILVSAIEENTGFTFEDADRNGDGKINKLEFEKYSKDLQENINRLFPYNGDMNLPKNPRVITDDGENVNAKNKDPKTETSNLGGFWSGFVSSIVSIWATEIGDKTFFIAAILSMSNDRRVVFAGAIGALVLMTVLSVVFGGVVGHYIPVEYTHYAGIGLFVFFGAKMLYDAKDMSGSGPSEELGEVEEELSTRKTDDESNTMEDGKAPGLRRRSSSIVAQSFEILSKAFALTFTAEWGDRSQIATITLASSKDPYGVTLGGCIGHMMCTGLAVVGGKLLASRISEKTVTIIGGVLFFVFALHSIISGPDN